MTKKEKIDKQIQYRIRFLKILLSKTIHIYIYIYI